MAPMRLLLVGCGKMGAALLRGAAAAGFLESATIIDPAGKPPEELTVPLTWHTTPEALPAEAIFDLILLAVKPQQMAAVLPFYARFTKSLFLSSAAGITLDRLRNLLGGEYAIVRTMPNLPASIGQGMSVAVANHAVTRAQQELADQFLKTVGATAWLPDEVRLDAVTALSGSGPAYVFALGEAMARAGEQLGLPPELAAQLARQTLIGSGALVAQSSESLEALRQAVTSPGGTTEAALRHLLVAGGLPGLISVAMMAARDRARELAQ